MSVEELLSQSVAQVALSLRATLQEWNSQRISDFLKWQNENQKLGSTCNPKFDANALTFVVTSWLFKNARWEDVDFGAKPVCYDHGGHLPGVCVLTSRPEDDGVNVWTSGTQEYVDRFMQTLGHW